MKKGDKIKVISLDSVDIGNIVIGDTGVIAKEYNGNDGQCDDVFYVKFDKPIASSELNANGTYCMSRNQLEVIEEVTVCIGCKWEHWLPESSNEPWCPCDVCEDGDQFEKEECT